MPQTARQIASQFATLIEALTPTAITTFPFRRHPIGEIEDLQKGNAGSLRWFDVRPGGREEVVYFGSDTAVRVQSFVIRVAYPVKSQMRDLELESLIQDDATQIRDELMNPNNYLADQQWTNVIVEEPERESDELWVLPLVAETQYLATSVQ